MAVNTGKARMVVKIVECVYITLGNMKSFMSAIKFTITLRCRDAAKNDI